VRVILAAIALAVAVALAAGGAFYLAQEPVYRAQPGPGVRVGDPGSNLVGEGWTGDPTLNDIRRSAGEAAKTESKDEG
jgi:hypothetical protein